MGQDPGGCRVCQGQFVQYQRDHLFENTTDLFVSGGHDTGLCGCDVGFPVGGSSNVRKGTLDERVVSYGAGIMCRWGL